jgi:hypothetical protein
MIDAFAYFSPGGGGGGSQFEGDPLPSLKTRLLLALHNMFLSYLIGLFAVPLILTRHSWGSSCWFQKALYLHDQFLCEKVRERFSSEVFKSALVFSGPPHHCGLFSLSDVLLVSKYLRIGLQHIVSQRIFELAQSIFALVQSIFALSQKIIVWRSSGLKVSSHWLATHCVSKYLWIGSKYLCISSKYLCIVSKNHCLTFYWSQVSSHWLATHCVSKYLWIGSKYLCISSKYLCIGLQHIVSQSIFELACNTLCLKVSLNWLKVSLH